MEERLGHDVTIIRSELEVAKVFAFIRARVRGKTFVFADELLDGLLVRLELWAAENGVRVSLELVRPNLTTTIVFGVGGAAAGAAAGYALTEVDPIVRTTDGVTEERALAPRSRRLSVVCALLVVKRMDYAMNTGSGESTTS